MSYVNVTALKGRIISVILFNLWETYLLAFRSLFIGSQCHTIQQNIGKHFQPQYYAWCFWFPSTQVCRRNIWFFFLTLSNSKNKNTDTFLKSPRLFIPISKSHYLVNFTVFCINWNHLWSLLKSNQCNTEYSNYILNLFNRAWKKMNEPYLVSFSTYHCFVFVTNLYLPFLQGINQLGYIRRAVLI